MSNLTDQDLYGLVGKPDAENIHQRLLGDCYFPAPYGALVTQQPGCTQNVVAYMPGIKACTVTPYQYGHGEFVGLTGASHANDW